MILRFLAITVAAMTVGCGSVRQQATGLPAAAAQPAESRVARGPTRDAAADQFGDVDGKTGSGVARDNRLREPAAVDHQPTAAEAEPCVLASDAQSLSQSAGHEAAKSEPVEAAMFQELSVPPAPSQDGGQNGADVSREAAPAREQGQADALSAEFGDLRLEEVINSVYQSYPLLEAALYSRNIATGQQLAAAGQFDLKFKAATENGPTGFYQTYRQSVGLVQPTYQGGEVFAGYRIGRGDFEPWYQERQTNDGGEFKVGLLAPLSRNRNIDARRAELWRSTFGRQQVEPEIQAQLIGFVQEASYVYWDWVAAGALYQIADRLLKLAEDRTERIRRQVEVGALDPPELTDNLRLVADRRAKLADATRKLQQTAFKLSLYYRDMEGQPLIPDPERLPEFPEPLTIDPQDAALDAQSALAQRPEIAVLELMQRQLDVDYAEAHNEFRPAVDAVVAASQDVGMPTSSKNDKGQFELDASVFVDVPLQRRKARGKMYAVQGKIAQVSAKRRMTEDKIVAEVNSAYAALMAAYEQVQQTRQAVAYAEDLARRERRNLELGASDVLKVTLREQYAAESAIKSVDAFLQYYRARADYRAALAQDRLP